MMDLPIEDATRPCPSHAEGPTISDTVEPPLITLEGLSLNTRVATTVKAAVAFILDSPARSQRSLNEFERVRLQASQLINRDVHVHQASQLDGHVSE